jgi:hypothetical protein
MQTSVIVENFIESLQQEIKIGHPQNTLSGIFQVGSSEGLQTQGYLRKVIPCPLFSPFFDSTGG